MYPHVDRRCSGLCLEENYWGIKNDGESKTAWLLPQALCPSWLQLPWNGAGWLADNCLGRDGKYAGLRARPQAPWRPGGTLFSECPSDNNLNPSNGSCLPGWTCLCPGTRESRRQNKGSVTDSILYRHAILIGTNLGPAGTETVSRNSTGYHGDCQILKGLWSGRFLSISQPLLSH